MASIYDVAREAGVSIGTVSYALNHTGRVGAETAERVRQAAAKLHYQPKAAAQALARGRTLTITVVAPLDIYAYQTSLLNLIAGIGAVLTQTDYRLYIHPTLNRPGSWMELEAAVRSHQMDGVILMHVQPGDPRVELLRKSTLPFVLIGRCEDTRGLSYVDADIDAAVDLAVQHLVDAGHQHIAMVGERGEARITSQLIQRFRMAIESRGIAFHPSWCPQVGTTPQDAAQAVQALLASTPRPTAIFAVSDLTVLGVLNAARGLGLSVPKDLAIIGYADSPIYPYLTPPVSAVFGGATDLGRISAELLLSRLSNQNEPPAQILVPPQLIIRASTNLSAA